MTLRELHKLVAQGEGQHLEFKRKAAHPDKIMREIAAFANSQGGQLLIGVDDDQSLPGLKHPDEDEFVIKQAMAKHLRPTVRYELNRVPLGLHRAVLVFHIYPSEERPVFVIYNFKRNTGRAYVRVADRSVQASREVRQILKLNGQGQTNGFTYGEHERTLFRHLGQHSTVTVEGFARLAGLPRETASDILVRLTLAGALSLHPAEEADEFAAKLG
ncbi:MAG: ATP-binding protein [Bernardetiaceae bacterium]|jgi:predicted HTH transcriptional regulator|nr:ATP-binding protein [Bernardetiaceae bacterium]